MRVLAHSSIPRSRTICLTWPAWMVVFPPRLPCGPRGRRGNVLPLYVMAKLCSRSRRSWPGAQVSSIAQISSRAMVPDDDIRYAALEIEGNWLAVGLMFSSASFSIARLGVA